MKTNTVKIEFIAEDGTKHVFQAIAANTGKAEKGVKGFGKSCEVAKGRSGDFIKGLIGFEVLKNVGRWAMNASKGFLDAASSSEQFTTRLKVLLGSQQEANRMMKEMTDYASRVPFEYENIMEAATQLAGIMKGGVDEVKQWMPMIGDLAATSGLSIQTTTEQVARMFSAGAASADLFRERGILSMMGFKAGVSYNVEETRKKMFEEWQKAGSQFKGATAELADDWKGLTSMMEDKWFAFKNRVMGSGVFDWMKIGLGEINAAIDEAFETGQAQQWAEDVAEGVLWAAEKVAVGVAWVMDAVTGWKLIFLTLKYGWISFSEWLWTTVDRIREKIVSLLEFGNVFGQFDGPIQKLKEFGKLHEATMTGLSIVKQQAYADLTSLASEELMSTKAKKFFENVHTKMDEIKQKAGEANAAAAFIAAPQVDNAQAIASLSEIFTTSAKAAKESIQSVKDAVTQSHEQATGEMDALLALQLTTFDTLEEETAAWDAWYDGMIKSQNEYAQGGARSFDELQRAAADLQAQMDSLKNIEMDPTVAIAELGKLKDEADKIKAEMAVFAEPHLKADALMKEVTQTIGDINKAADNLAPFELEADNTRALLEVGSVQQSINALEVRKSINLDPSQAIAGAAQAQAAIDSIPDISYKTVIIEYLGKTSPPGPIHKKIEGIKKAQAGLSGKAKYQIDFESSVMGGATVPVSQGIGNVSYLMARLAALSGNIDQSSNDPRHGSGGSYAREAEAIWKMLDKVTGAGGGSGKPQVVIQKIEIHSTYQASGKGGRQDAVDHDTQLANMVRRGTSNLGAAIKKEVLKAVQSAS